MANFNFNKVILGGRLCEDPELKTTPSGVMVTTFTVAVNRRAANDGKVKADFFNVTAWRGTAEFITKYFRKASSICVVGTIQLRNWVDNSGQRHYVTEVIAEEAYFVDAKGESKAPAGAAEGQAPVYAPLGGLEELGDDEELPFSVDL